MTDLPLCGFCGKPTDSGMCVGEYDDAGQFHMKPLCIKCEDARDLKEKLK